MADGYRILYPLGNGDARARVPLLDATGAPDKIIPMSITPTGLVPQIGVGIVCLHGPDVLLIRRAKPPKQGEWSLPGGRLEWGETVRAAALRELREETGVEAELLGLIDVVDGLFRDGRGALRDHYVLVDYAARWLSGEPKGASDALEARFFPIEAIDELGLWAETARVIRAGAQQVLSPAAPNC